MPVSFFKVPLTIAPKPGGTAEIIIPEILKNFTYHFVIVKEGAEEGIVRVEASESELEHITNIEHCVKLEPEQLKALYESYPPPKFKQQFQARQPIASSTESDAPSVPTTPDGQFEIDETGNPIVQTLQTVRSGFYLIDIPIAHHS
jgi:hypothetical protein